MSPANEPPSASSQPVVGSRIRPFLERYGRPLLVLSTLAVLLVPWALWTARYRTLLGGYEKAYEPAFLEREFSGLAPHEVMLLGTAHSPDLRPASSYSHFSQEKAPGTLRIGIFGGSFVAGAETPPGADFPSQLQERLAEESAVPVEVLNFGVGGYGIHQAVLMWRLLGERYDIDIAVFDIFSFHTRRDQGFVHMGYGPVHSRFVLGADGEPRRIDPLGRDRRDAIEQYFRFLPRWQYLRYDVRGPAALRAFLPPDREITRSPFYYWDGPLEEESARLATALLASVAEESAAPIVICNDTWSCGLRQGLEGAGVYVMKSSATEVSWKRPSLYRAPRGHLSSLGNRIVAEELATVLAGRRQGSVSLLEWKPLPGRATSPEGDAKAHRPNLRGASRIALLADRGQLGEFVVGSPKSRSVRRPQMGDMASLLDMSTSQELRFLPLGQTLARRSPVHLRFVCAGEVVSGRVGFIDAPTGLLGRFVPAPGKAVAAVQMRNLGGRFSMPCGEPREVEVAVAGRPIFRGQQVARRPGVPAGDPPEFKLVPIERALLYLRSHRLQKLDPSLLPERGILRLAARREGKVSLFAPVARWQIQPHRLSFPQVYPRALPLRTSEGERQ